MTTGGREPTCLASWAVGWHVAGRATAAGGSERSFGTSAFGEAAADDWRLRRPGDRVAESPAIRPRPASAIRTTTVLSFVFAFPGRFRVLRRAPPRPGIDPFCCPV